MDYITYNSKEKTDYIEIRAPYYNAINPTTVCFENEGISVFVNSLGHIEFFDTENKSLGFVDVPAAESPDQYGHSGQYGTVWCKGDGEEICVQLPVYGWEDGYPHCDGESDRWSRYEVCRFCVVFRNKTKQISVINP